MADAIQANYIPDVDDWTITIIGRGRTLTARAPGIIAARDRTDQLVEELTPDEEHRTVVHLLNGDAVEFTTAYLTARMAKAGPEAPVEATAPDPVENPPPAEPSPAARKTPSPRPREAEPTVVTSPEAEPAPDEVPTLN